MSNPSRELDAPAAALIEARGLAREYPGGRRNPPVVALSGVDLLLRAGEMLGVAGPSGSGKTTLLHLLAGIDTPTRGAVAIAGHDVGGLSRGARARLRLAHVGLVFAEHNLSPALTATENVDLPLALRGMPGAERARRAASALERLGVGRLAGRFPADLSSGEQQRVAVARAIAGEPAVLIADEPTAHVDSETGAALLAALAELIADRRMAVIVATHDAAVLAQTGRVLRLHDGTVRQEPA
jgi:putative ABC transport system ATP-binding protein